MTAEQFVLIVAVLVLTCPVWLVPLVGICLWVSASRTVDRIVREEMGTRGEAAERSDEEESFDLAVDEAILLTHEPLSDIEESDEDAADIVLWEAELKESAR